MSTLDERVETEPDDRATTTLPRFPRTEVATLLLALLLPSLDTVEDVAQYAWSTGATDVSTGYVHQSLGTQQRDQPTDGLFTEITLPEEPPYGLPSVIITSQNGVDEWEDAHGKLRPGIQDGTVLARAKHPRAPQEYPFHRPISSEVIQDAAPLFTAGVLYQEDRRFPLKGERSGTHNGPSRRGTLRAAGQYLGNLVGLTDTVTGGSTITSQLVDFYIRGDEDSGGAWRLRSSESTATDKIREYVEAIKLQNQYSPDQIFEMYANTAGFAARAHGVHAGAQRYFSDDIDELSLKEQVWLSSVLTSPATYEHMAQEHPEGAEAIVNDVITDMLRDKKARKDMNDVERWWHGQNPVDFIGLNQLRRARSQDLTFNFSTMQTDELSQDLIDQIVDEYEQRSNTYWGTVTLETGIDKTVQETLEEHVRRLDNELPADYNTTAYVVGEGGRIEGFVNTAEQKRPARSPASLLKPLVVDWVTDVSYREGGHDHPFADPEQITVNDVKLNSEVYDTAFWKEEVRELADKYAGDMASNHDGLYKGEIPLKQAIRESRNMGVVNLALTHLHFQDAGRGGIGAFLEYLDDRNVSESIVRENSAPTDLRPQVFIGNLVNERYDPAQLGEVYRSFYKQGKVHNARFIQKIVEDNAYGDERSISPKQSLVPSSASHEPTQLLRSVLDGTGASMLREVEDNKGQFRGGKTGTNDRSANAVGVIIDEQYKAIGVHISHTQRNNKIASTVPGRYVGRVADDLLQETP